MIEGLRGIRLPVPDLEAAASWYALLLDAQPFGGPGARVFSVAGGTLELVAMPPQRAAIAMDAQPATAALVDLPQGPIAFWGVDHLGSELGRLADAGIRPLKPPGLVDPATQMAWFTDPFNNLVALVERDDPGARRARSQRVAEKVALRKVRGKVDEMVDEQRRLDRFGALVIRALAVAVVVLLGLFLLWRAASGR